MEDTVWSTMPDTCTSLCKCSSLQELTSRWNAIFQFSKLLIQFCFRVTKRAVIKAGAAQENDGCASPLPKSGAARTSRTWEKLPPKEALWHLAAAQPCLWARLPLNFRPSWTGHHDSHCLHSILAAVPNFAVPWHTCLPLCIRWHQSRSALI